MTWGYMEEVFERMESQVTGKEAQFAWLERFTRKKVPGGLNAFESDAVDLFNEWAQQKEIIRKVQGETSLRRIARLQQEAEDLSSSFTDSSDARFFEDYRDEALGEINNRIAALEGEVEKLKQDYKTSRTYGEKDSAEELLREISPQSLGGIKSGESRYRGSKKEQKAVAQAFAFVSES